MIFTFLPFSVRFPVFLGLATIFLPGCRTSQASQSSGGPEAQSVAEAGAGAEAQSEAGAEAQAVAEAGADAEADAQAEAGASTDAGTDAGEVVVSPCPPDMTKIGRYCVDRWEAHLVASSADGLITPWPHHDQLKGDQFYIARSDPGAFPQAYISRVQAKAACEHAGKRLCSRSEWVRACKGKHGFRYPYGNKGKRGACNTGKPHLLEKYYGNKRRSWTYEIFNDPKLDQEPGFLGKASDYETCQSDEGIYDMVGNLHEWVADKVDSDIEDILARDEVERRKQPWKVGNGIFMGGFFSTTDEHGPGCTFTTIAHEPQYHDYSTGFRCCEDAKLPPAPEKKGKKKKKK